MFFSEDSSARIDVANVRTGYLDLGFVRKGTKTMLGRRLYSYPFSVSRVFYVDTAPLGMGSVILQTASGTLNAGDRLLERLHTGAMSSAHVTTQGAAVVHRSPAGMETVERVELVADEGSLLEYLPELRILFPDSRFSQTTTLQLGARSIAITCDGFVVYDPAHAGRSFRSFVAETEILGTEGRVLAKEAVYLDRLPAMTGRRAQFRAFGTLFIAALIETQVHDGLREAIGCAMSSFAGLYWSVSALPNQCGVSLRIAAQDGGMLRAGIRTGWLTARKHLFGSVPGMLHKAGST
jgi:urease accessory protein